jgi:hypothetical protein
VPDVDGSAVRKTFTSPAIPAPEATTMLSIGVPSICAAPTETPPRKESAKARKRARYEAKPSLPE